MTLTLTSHLVSGLRANCVTIFENILYSQSTYLDLSMTIQQSILAHIEELKANNSLIIVRDPQDKAVLAKFGLTNVWFLNRPMFIVVQDIVDECDSVVLLFDLDPQGDKVVEWMTADLQKYEVKVDNRLRDLMKQSKINTVADLAKYC